VQFVQLICTITTIINKIWPVWGFVEISGLCVCISEISCVIKVLVVTMVMVLAMGMMMATVAALMTVMLPGHVVVAHMFLPL